MSTDIELSGFFFFSSRRRHTRCYRDWSSDVCSSDLLSTERGRSPSTSCRRDFGQKPPAPCVTYIDRPLLHTVRGGLLSLRRVRISSKRPRLSSDRWREAFVYRALPGGVVKHLYADRPRGLGVARGEVSL